MAFQPILTVAIVVLSLLVLTQPAASCGRGSIYIINNEYRQILIAIAENVPENPTLLDRIRDVFTEASEFLFRSTRLVMIDILLCHQ